MILFFKTFDYKNFNYKRGERLSSSLIVFKNDYYYVSEGGLIDIPYAYLKENYNYYIYDSYVTTIRDFKPENIPAKNKISEMSKEQFETLNKHTE